MAKIASTCLLFGLLLLADLSLAAVDPPATSPVAPPESGDNNASPVAQPPASAPSAEVPSPESSPPAPDSSSPSPSPSPVTSSPPPAASPDPSSPPAPLVPSPSPSSSPAPAPAPSDPSHISHAADETVGEEGAGSEGMSAGKKAGIVIGVIVGAGLVVIGGMIYKKRRDNIRRSQYGYSARNFI